MKLRGRWSEKDIVPTVVDMLKISPSLLGDSKNMPVEVEESHELHVSSAPQALHYRKA